MLEYHTGLDKLGLRIEFDNAIEQREIILEIFEYIRKKYESVFIEKKESHSLKEYFIHQNKKTIFGVVSGCYRKKNPKVSGYYLQYYLNITFAGLKRYDERLDDLTKNILYSVYAFLNTKKIEYANKAADIYLDIKCPFENIVSLCVKKSPSVKYYKLDDVQEKVNINYIERVSGTNYNKTALRGYWYNKATRRVKLKYPLTRFELKLQPKYFYRYGFSIDAMEKALERYYVLFFENEDEKKEKISKYINYKHVAKRELKKLEFDKYKLKFDISAITKFLNWLDSAYDEDLIPEEQDNSFKDEIFLNY